MKTHPCIFILLAFIVSAATGVIARVTGCDLDSGGGGCVSLYVLLAVVVQWLKGRTRKAVGAGGTPPEDLPGMSPAIQYPMSLRVKTVWSVVLNTMTGE